MDENAVIGGLLRDMAFAQESKAKMFGYKRAAAAILSLEHRFGALIGPDGQVPKIPGLGPASLRICFEVAQTASSPTVERAVAASPRRDDVERRRTLWTNVLSRAEVLRVLADADPRTLQRRDYRGDFQMHSEWSDGVPSLDALVAGCRQRGYSYCAVTDHSHGLPIAGGMTMEQVVRQHAAIDALNRAYGSTFRLIKGIEANIRADGSLDLSAEETALFELVLAAPHAKLRVPDDQTARLMRALAAPHVHILAHPRGRIAGSRPGITADWDVIFAEAARRNIAVEIDGDPARQDLDYGLAKRALEAACLFALDSDAHTVGQLSYADTAIAHAKLAGIPADRIINCWPLDKLLAWMEARRC